MSRAWRVNLLRKVNDVTWFNADSKVRSYMQPQTHSLPVFVSLDSYIVSTPDTLGGKPRIAGHRIAVTHVKSWRLRWGMSEAEISAVYDLPIAAVYAAMAYYYAHKSEIDQRDVDDAAFIEDFKLQHPSPLAAKLQAMRQS